LSTLSINDIKLYYDVSGKGEPLLLIAGMGSDSQSWDSILPELTKQFTVITFDNRGSGRTTPHEAPFSIQDLTEDAIALIKHLKFEKISILGHSMGGFVAQDCAIRYPEYVSNLILAATYPCNSQRNNELFSDWISNQERGLPQSLWFKTLFYWIFTKKFFCDCTILEGAIQGSIHYPYPQSPTAFKNQVKAIRDFNVVDNLPKIKHKTTIICGEEDILFFADDIIKAFEKIPNKTIYTIKNAAHSIHVEQPTEFIKVVNNG
jgi:pimeloyl-ACP methyl ester carboxylesterase